MADPRKQLEDVTFQWFDDDISDNEYTEFANKYLTSRNFRLYKYQNPFVSLESLNRFYDQLKTNNLSLCAPSTFNDPFDGQFTVPDWVDPQALYWMRNATDEIWRIGCLALRENRNFFDRNAVIHTLEAEIHGLVASQQIIFELGLVAPKAGQGQARRNPHRTFGRQTTLLDFFGDGSQRQQVIVVVHGLIPLDRLPPRATNKKAPAKL